MGGPPAGRGRAGSGQQTIDGGSGRPPPLVDRGAAFVHVCSALGLTYGWPREPPFTGGLEEMTPRGRLASFRGRWEQAIARDTPGAEPARLPAFYFYPASPVGGQMVQSVGLPGRVPGQACATVRVFGKAAHTKEEAQRNAAVATLMLAEECGVLPGPSPRAGTSGGRRAIVPLGPRGAPPLRPWRRPPQDRR